MAKQNRLTPSETSPSLSQEPASVKLTPSLPVIEALPSRRELELKLLSSKKIENLVQDVISQIPEEGDPYRWKLALLLSRFQNTAGEVFSGKELLEALTEQLYRERFPTSRKTLQKINEEPGHSVNDVYDEFLLKNYDVPPLSTVLAGCSVPVPVPSSFRESELAENAVEELQRVVARMCEDAFHGDMFAMTASTVAGITISLTPPKSSKRAPREVTGEELLKALSLARFVADGREHTSEKAVLRAAGYKIADTLLDARAQLLMNRTASERNFLVEVSTLDLASLTQGGDKAALEGALKQVFNTKFQGREREVSYKDLFPIKLVDGEGFKVSAPVLLARYAEVLFRDAHPGEEKTVDQILRMGEFSLVATLASFKRGVLGIGEKKSFPLTFRSFTSEQIDDFIIEERLGGVIAPLGLNPAVLIESLSILSPDSFVGRDVSDFVRRYVGLQIERKASIERNAGTPDLEHNPYIEALMAALRAHKRLGDLGGNYQHHQRLFIRELRPNFEQDPQGTIDGLRHQTEQYATGKDLPFDEKGRTLLETLHRGAADYFDQALRFELKCVKTAPFPYQREGARFLASRNAAILADDVGLGKTYQAAAAALAIDAKRILWVTTASSKENVKSDLLEHFDLSDHDVQVITDRSSTHRSSQIKALNGTRFVITNYETLVALQSRHREEYEKLTSKLDVLVLDESQRTDNESSLRSRAVQSITAQHKWMLSATPYQNRIENMWTVLNQLAPERFPNRAAFKDLYIGNTRGLILLHEVLSDMMLRRTKTETITRFEDPREVGFREQLAQRSPRLPSLRAVEPAQEGYVDLSKDQETVIAWMIADFRDWANHFNHHHAVDGTEIDLNSISPLLKFHWIHVAMYQPHLAGITSGNPILEEARRIAEQRVSQGEKVILWAWNTPIIEELTHTLGHLGAQRFDGTMATVDKTVARLKFQDKANAKVLVANYQSGGVAQTFTAANTAIVAQLPLVFPTLLQVEGRHNRVIGLNNIRHAKQFSDVVYIIPRFSKEFLASQRSGKLKELLESGTLAEQTFSRLAGSRVVYNFIMEGYGDPNELKNELHRSLLKSMGLSNDGPALELGEGLRERKQRLLKVADTFLPVWEIAGSERETESLILSVIESFRAYPKTATALAEVFAKHGKVPQADLQLALKAVSIENKFLREALIRHLPVVMDRVYADGSPTLAAESELSIEAFVLRISNSAVPEQLKSLSREISECQDTAHFRRQRERFAAGMLGVIHCESGDRILRDNRKLFEGQSMEARVRCVYQFGLLAQLSPKLFDEMDGRYSSFEELTRAVHGKIHNALEDFADKERGSAELALKADPRWNGSMDHLAALLIGWKTLDDEGLVEEFREALGAILDGEFHRWRYASGSRSVGRGVSYLSDKPDFWKAFEQNCRIQLDIAPNKREREVASLQREYAAVVRAVQPAISRVEGSTSAAMLQKFDLLPPQRIAYTVANLELQRAAIGKTLSRKDLTPDERSVAQALRLETEDISNLTVRTSLTGAVRDLEAALGWASIHRFVTLAGDGVAGEAADAELKKALGAITRKVRYYQQGREDRIADSLSNLAQRLHAVAGAEKGPIVFRIEESDSPADLSKMGNLEDDLVNCFNPNGNPTFTSFVVGALGSKNMKFIIVRNAQGQAIANAMMKLRRDENGAPVLYLERGLASGAHDFREEMLELLAAKAKSIEESCGIRPRVMGQVFGRVRDTDPEVFGTGCYTEHEYVEAVFHFRRGKNIRHHASEFAVEGTESMSAHAVKSAPSVFLGIGTANKRIEDYVRELKEIGATRVVDVRAVPMSGRFPHFCRDQLKSHLKRNGIEYSWLGDTLGNPLDANGKRTLEGFDQYRSDPRYEQGLQQLIALAEKPEDVIAVTCAENKESECHRKFILQDVRARWVSRGSN